MYIVGVDPGRIKCGVAVLSAGGTVREQHVVPRNNVFAHLGMFRETYGTLRLVIGDRTGSREFLRELESHPVRTLIDEIHLVDEHLSTLEARDRYFDANPPRGLRRIIPRSMQLPPVPIDDYVAVILAERFLEREAEARR